MVARKIELTKNTMEWIKFESSENSTSLIMMLHCDYIKPPSYNWNCVSTWVNRGSPLCLRTNDFIGSTCNSTRG
jgi:hypothetical protein